jgi:cyclohexanecarboxylate-CoA ligase
VLYEHPDVAAVAVVGLPDPRLQERACAVVVPKSGAPGFTMDDMRAFLAEKGVARQYWPERLELFPELPRTESGKIRKVELRDMLRSASELASESSTQPPLRCEPSPECSGGER